MTHPISLFTLSTRQIGTIFLNHSDSYKYWHTCLSIICRYWFFYFWLYSFLLLLVTSGKETQTLVEREKQVIQMLHARLRCSFSAGWSGGGHWLSAETLFGSGSQSKKAPSLRLHPHPCGGPHPIPGGLRQQEKGPRSFFSRKDNAKGCPSSAAWQFNFFLSPALHLSPSEMLFSRLLTRTSHSCKFWSQYLFQDILPTITRLKKWKCSYPLLVTHRYSLQGQVSNLTTLKPILHILSMTPPLVIDPPSSMDLKGS